ncbi:hypothetical protein KSF78_0007862 [Schistosoma japonicum]|nr:hypothetical protein KSF78_0007862 [Schistosoma japonicum]
MESSSTNNTTCSPITSSISNNNPLFYTSLSCVLIGLLIGLIIIFNEKLRTPLTRNTVIMIITIVCQVLSCASWCCVMFIVVFWSTWYLRKHYNSSQYSVMFIIFTILYEFGILSILLQFVFSVTGCMKTNNSTDHQNTSILSSFSYLHSL